MDRETRNHIQRVTQAARALLEHEYAEQFEGVFDIRLEGTIEAEPGEHLDAAQRVLRRRLVMAVEHQRVSANGKAGAVVSYLREAAFTTLNRYVALKMLEARELVQECISRGDQSAGFKEFTALAPGLVQLPDHGYRVYIESLFDEIGREVRVLFERRDPGGLLWPRRQALLDLLGILNAPELRLVWGEDETIGWVYQYFNSDEERRRMRAESQAPRNSRELAVRNQFFTPRYVVEFLNDNTLGRIWHEMRRGETQLRDLDYLVRSPNEVFLAEGDEPLADADAGDFRQEDLLQRRVYVRFRAKKDPRDIRVLDPACGSGHFLLYAFDLLLTIYEEAWVDPASPASEATGGSLRNDYPAVEALWAAVPGLILRHNLHGIDIDARCAQIAALALWMRAQRTFSDLRIARSDRPSIRRTNIVIAEPMPGDRELRREFAGTLERNLSQLVERVFDLLELAGDAGALLRVGEGIREAVREAFPAASGDLLGLLDEDRWRTAEVKVLQALRAYAESASDGGGLQRRLFAEDALRGLGFVDLSTIQYDVVVMNPPFGDASAPSLERLDSLLGSSGRDIGAAFVRDAAERWCPGGYIGVLLSTAPWFKPAFEQWRADLFFGEQAQLRVCAHFGGEVLDGATVNASPMVISMGGASVADVLRLTRATNLEMELQEGIAAIQQGRSRKDCYVVSPREACALPGAPFSYWLSRRFLRRIRQLPPFEGSGGTVKQGTATADEFRFARAWWEVPPASQAWIPYVKTSPYSPFWDDVTWVGKFEKDLHEIDATGRARVQGVDYFNRAGVTYTSKSVLGFNPRLHPAGCGFGHTGSVVFAHDVDPLALLGFFGSRPVEYLLSLFVGELQGKAGVHPNHYEVGTIQRLPWPGLCGAQHDTLRAEAARAVRSLRYRNAIDEVTRSFVSPVIDPARGVVENAALAVGLERQAIESVCVARERADRAVARSYGLTENDLREIDSAFAGRIPPAKGKWRVYFGEAGADIDDASYARDVISWAVGVGLGRWRPVSAAEPNEDPAALLVPPSLWPPGSAREESGNGILVDDPGHRQDIARVVRANITAGLGDSPDSILDEVAELLGVGAAEGIRQYLRTSFFAHHIKRYSKSRRKAPIYWQLATLSASYSVWLYYHRFSRDTMYRVLNDYVTPKLKHEERRLASQAQEGGANASARQRKEVDAQERFVSELRSFQEDLARVAPLWNPDLNDGVIINFAPLWRLVPQHRDRQRECKNCWEKLVKGDYDWANIAMHLWPERVVPKCAEDRSLAIAHGLEDIFWYVDSDGKWQPRKVAQAEVDKLIKERTSAAVKDALRSLLDVPAPATGRASRKKAPRARGTVRRRLPLGPLPRRTAHLPPDRSPAAVDAGLLSKVKEAIGANGDGASKTDAIDATGITASEWNMAIKALLADGSVTQTGERRGARYHLAGEGDA